jgi:flagellar M-ring protein FliF
MYYVRLFARPLLNTLLALLFLLMVVRPLVLAITRPRVSGGEVRSGEGGGHLEGERRMALGGGSEGMESVDAARQRLEDVKEVARDSVTEEHGSGRRAGQKLAQGRSRPR